eukprot:s3705_g6.t1
MSSSSLADRFAAVQEVQTKSAKVQQLMTMSMEELQNMTIKFGTAKAGMSFKDVVEKDPKYCQWFLRQWGSSTKAEHQEFLFFLNMWTERKELESGIDGGHTQPQLPIRPMPKAHGGGRGAASTMQVPIDLEIDEEPWDQISLNESLMPPKVMSRIDRLEEALMQVVTQLQSMNQPAAAAQSD